MKKLFLLALTTFALFSCSNGDDSIPEQKTKSVVVKFAPSSLSRAVGDAVSTGAAAEIKDYTIYFLDAAGNVVEGTTDAATSPGSDAVVCSKVGATAVSVYVVANTGSSYANIDLSGITPANNSTLVDIKAKFAGVSTQKTITSVVLSNSDKSNNGKIAATTNEGVTTYAAAVEIAPAIARLEISKIIETGTGISGFKLEGIYIDGHAVNFNIGGGYDKTATDTNIKDGIYSIGVDHTQLTGYPTDFCDVQQITATSQGSDYEAVPATASKIWAYQLAAGADLPKIVVKLSDVDGVAGTKYVTVTKYKVGDSEYTSKLAPGTVYKIDNITFEVSNTAEVPNATEKEVDVTVTVKGWTVVSLTPEV